MQATKMLSESPRFVYVNEYGERDPRLNPDKRESLGRAIEWIADHRGASPRASFEKFQTGVEKDGLVLDTEAFRAGLNARREVAEGGEHTVYLDRQTQRALKISHPDVLGDGSIGHPKNIREYLHNLYLHNQEFGDDIRLEGVVNLHLTPFPQVVISQPWIKRARPATLSEKKEYFTGHGYEYHADKEVFIKTTGDQWLLVGDHDGDNVLARDTKEGVQVFPIDTQLLTSPCWPELQGK